MHACFLANCVDFLVESIHHYLHRHNSLIYNYLDEYLYIFHDSGFIVKDVDISEITTDNERNVFKIISSSRGEKLDLSKHSQGTEIKAITYSNMQVKEKEVTNKEAERSTNNRCDVWVIVDI